MDEDGVFDVWGGGGGDGGNEGGEDVVVGHVGVGWGEGDVEFNVDVEDG